MDTLSSHADNGNIPLKQCLKCPEGQQWHPATPEFFNRDKQKSDGLYSSCKMCQRKKERTYYVEHLRAHRQNPEYREKRRVRQQAYYHQNQEYRERQIEYLRAYRQQPENKERLREQRRVRFQRPDVREHHQEWMRAYYQRPEIVERMRERQRAYRQLPERQEWERERGRQRRQLPEYRERMREYHRDYSHRPENREYGRAIKARRRAREAAVSGNYTAKDIQALLVQQKYRCYSKRCGNAKFKRSRVNGIWQYEYHIDHIIPLSRPECHPTNDISNIGLLCPSCNMSKGGKLLCEWPEGGILIWDGGLVVKRNLLTEHQKGFLS